MIDIDSQRRTRRVRAGIEMREELRNKKVWAPKRLQRGGPEVRNTQRDMDGTDRIYMYRPFG